ncbi:biflaviolin synthase CYP158A2 [Streptomyces longispororuber]|uniref:Biflaviolin synthase CYP158A2 n=1 Tax=Streptomyces longispororuber TaxID=68230 RepID=A0A919A8A0_9ACTN|nr:cytochrome P450 [Streptomyces longispororuber]GHE90906.1 biflaviolin synthase CYP158A2 [Streptomyces longispororuber]
MHRGSVPLYRVDDLPALDFDPFLRASVDAHPVRRIRLPHGEGDCWLVTQYELVRAVTSDPRFSRDIVGRPIPKMTRHFIPLDRAVSFVDPPEHARVRSVVAPAFSRPALERLRSRVRAVLDARLDRLVGQGPPADLVHHVTSPFPLDVIGLVLGIPEADRLQVRDWATTLLTRASDEAAARRAEGVKQDARAYFRELAGARRADPGDDVMTLLVRAVDRGTIDEEELLALATLIGLNGWHAVSNNTANMVYALLTSDGLWERLCAEPETVPRAVTELFRWVPHKHGVGQPRVATEDVVVGGEVIREGEYVYVSYVAANWDARVYPDPGRIDFDRQGPPHLAFGHGPHFCVGPLLAQVEAEVLLAGLTERLPSLRLAVPVAEVPWQTRVLIRGPEALPVRW